MAVSYVATIPTKHRPNVVAPTVPTACANRHERIHEVLRLRQHLPSVPDISHRAQVFRSHLLHHQARTLAQSPPGQVSPADGHAAAAPLHVFLIASTHTQGPGAAAAETPSCIFSQHLVRPDTSRAAVCVGYGAAHQQRYVEGAAFE